MKDENTGKEKNKKRMREDGGRGVKGETEEEVEEGRWTNRRKRKRKLKRRKRSRWKRRKE